MMSNQNDELEEIETLLFDAIDSGNLETVKKIFLKGVNNNQCLLNFGYTPLEYAVEKGELSIVQSMLSTGCLPRSRQNGTRCKVLLLHLLFDLRDRENPNNQE
ncbi:ankyrin repeat domain-containing protein [Scytonema sp. NUACC26]|uniref:ankyrin repeat domain-containing protein n=1 Tax=Scytonema sp. NUACC26 TaxID=3140176 RepID=UPI0038B2A89E